MAAPLRTLKGSLDSLNPLRPRCPLSLCPSARQPLPSYHCLEVLLCSSEAKFPSLSPPTGARMFPETVPPAPPCSSDPDFKCRLKKKKRLWNIKE